VTLAMALLAWVGLKNSSALQYIRTGSW